uniref:Tc1-like transposase DDE domain-containing protein n=1 Tax=Nothobranchius kuhntae TaxID=321403 RepID=A0A1A8KV51_NOTKU
MSQNLLHNKGEGCKKISKASHISRNTAAKVIQKCKKEMGRGETKMTVFGTNGFKTVWRRKGEDFKEKCMVPIVKHGGGCVLMWACISAAGVVAAGIMNSTMYCSILKEKMLPSLCALGRRALFQHDNDPEHTSKAAVAYLKNRVKVTG